MKINREAVLEKYGGRCAYCGIELNGKFQVDHILPKRNGGTDDFENLNPACVPCNNRKNVLSVEQFRNEIEQQTARLRMYSSQYRTALRYGLVSESHEPVVFLFEDYGDK